MFQELRVGSSGSGGVGGVGRRLGGRGGAPFRGVAAEPAYLVATVCRRSDRIWVIARRGRMVCPHQMSPAVEARVVEMQAVASGLGCGPDRLPAGARWGIAGAGPDQYLSGAGAERVGRAGQAAAASGGLSAVGAGPADGVVADGCGRRLPPADGAELKAVSGSMTTPGSWSRRSWCARATARPVCDALLAALRRHGDARSRS